MGFVRMKRQRGSVTGMIVAFLAGLALAAGFSRDVVAQAARPLTIVVLGDSLSAGHGLPRAAAFPEVLERTLRTRGHNVEMVNAGVSGDTAIGGLERLDWSVPEGTDGVIVALGANDMLRGIDPAVTRQALEAIVTRLKARGIPVMLAGMYAQRNLGPAYTERFDAIYRELAERHGLVLYPFFLDGVAGDRALNLPDGLHPTAQGIERIVERILPSVEVFLGRLNARAG
jgi:acyl-CoA thioesterase-1